jgi:hypothetical protein
MSSFKAEVIADASGTWSSNSLRFATEAEAEAYVRNLMGRWMSVRQTRVVPSDDQVSHAWSGTRAVSL